MVMDMEREAVAIAEAMKGLFGMVRGELVAVKGELAAVKGELEAVREEVARQKERVLMLEEKNADAENEVNELRRALGVVEERSVTTAAVVEEKGRELAAVKGELVEVKGELTATKRELTEHRSAMAEQWKKRTQEMDVREYCKEAGTGEAVLADATAPPNVDSPNPNPQAHLSKEDEAFKKHICRGYGDASTKRADDCCFRIRILGTIGARIGFTALRDRLTVRTGKVCPESFEDLKKSKLGGDKVKEALELVRAGLEDEAWGQKQYPNSWSSWVKESEGFKKRPREP
ncbi:unnamed protein product [Closterium sp. Yama58-4]|nr:unnamed protein product [Closterium sp. Yama58-4]